MTRVLFGVFVAGALGLGASQERQAFRTVTDLVSVDVSVRSGNRPVIGLRAADFEVTDNGVVQQIDLVDPGAVPLDVTIALDLSGSMVAAEADVRKQVSSLAASLPKGDRLRLMTIADEIMVPIAFDSGGAGAAVGLAPAPATALTPLYDGLAAALMTGRDTDRRHLVIAITDGLDTASALTFDALTEIARRSDSVLYLYQVSAGTPSSLGDRERVDTRGIWWPPATAAPDRLAGLITLPDFATLARSTGGWFEQGFATGRVPRRLRDTIDEFRASYVLRYRATGVERSGWHEIAVKIVKPGSFEVRARKGYQG